MTQLRAAAVTDVGRVRPHNEDEVLIVDDRLFAVADGMGGAAAGEVASQIAVETLQSAFALDPTPDGLAEAVRSASAAVWQRAQDDPETRGMGTTLTAAALVEDQGEQILEVAHVGDSRAYLFRDGELSQLTDDHSVVEQLVREGRLSPEDAVNHPQRHIVTRVLGMESRDGGMAELDVDVVEISPFRGDRLLLASDGLTNEVSDDQIASVLRRFADPEEAARELVRLAKAAGGNDNISVVVIDVVDDDNKAGRASAALAGDKPAPPASRTIAEPAPDVDDATRVGGMATVAPPKKRAPRPRTHVTGRTVAFIGAIVVVLLLGLGAFTLYASESYFVGLKGDKVAVFRGRPGGFLWIDPSVVATTALTLDDIPRHAHDDLKDGHAVGSKKAGQRYITNLNNEAKRQAELQSTTTTAPSSPTTLQP